MHIVVFLQVICRAVNLEWLSREENLDVHLVLALPLSHCVDP